MNIQADRKIKTRSGDRGSMWRFLLVLTLVPGAVSVWGAEPTMGCWDLATRFASGPDQMAVQAIAELGTCITTEIAGRLSTPTPSATPRVEGTPPTAIQGEAPSQSTTRQRQWGAWPPAPPWPGDWPQPSPW